MLLREVPLFTVLSRGSTDRPTLSSLLLYVCVCVQKYTKKDGGLDRSDEVGGIKSFGNVEGTWKTCTQVQKHCVVCCRPGSNPARIYIFSIWKRRFNNAFKSSFKYKQQEIYLKDASLNRRWKTFCCLFQCKPRAQSFFQLHYSEMCNKIIIK